MDSENYYNLYELLTGGLLDVLEHHVEVRVEGDELASELDVLPALDVDLLVEAVLDQVDRLLDAEGVDGAHGFRQSAIS